jgi:hypothetical protein
MCFFALKKNFLFFASFRFNRKRTVHPSHKLAKNICPWRKSEENQVSLFPARGTVITVSKSCSTGAALEDSIAARKRIVRSVENRAEKKVGPRKALSEATSLD